MRQGDIVVTLWVCSGALDRVRIDRTQIVGSIDTVNPVYINSVEQIHAVDRIAGGDSNQPRSALGGVGLHSVGPAGRTEAPWEGLGTAGQEWSRAQAGTQ